MSNILNMDQKQKWLGSSNTLVMATISHLQQGNDAPRVEVTYQITDF